MILEILFFIMLTFVAKLLHEIRDEVTTALWMRKKRRNDERPKIQKILVKVCQKPDYKSAKSTKRCDSQHECERKGCVVCWRILLRRRLRCSTPSRPWNIEKIQCVSRNAHTGVRRILPPGADEAGSRKKN